MAVILNGFQARYVDVQGDGLFGLFSGKGSRFLAAACAITMKTQVETVIAERFRKDVFADWALRAGIGVDRGRLLVRQLGLRGTGMNEVWAGTPVNMAAKLSRVAGPNEVVVSERVFSDYQQSAKIRQRVLLWSCGCKGNTRGGGLGLACEGGGISLAKRPCAGKPGVGLRPGSPDGSGLVSYSWRRVLRSAGYPPARERMNWKSG